MHWLQTLDTNLFHFINRSLSNPFCDWLMPILSGNVWFIPLAILLVLCVLCFGNTRARLCALIIILVIALGDPLVVSTIKKAIARPRPFVALPEDRLFGTVGKGHIPLGPNGNDLAAQPNKDNRDSMPSAHAANWAAMTMVMFLFYRRSLWLMLPLALVVCFSRIYNGMHYPSDILVGGILGAGYSIAGITVLQAAWNFIGKIFFPQWYERLPLLLNPKSTNLNVQLSTPDTHWLRLCYFLIFAMLISRWIYLASGAIDLVMDEAYQWVWSKHLALSYYSKPPGIALIQFVSTWLFGDTEFGVRFFSPLFAAIMSVMMLRFIMREVDAVLAFWLLLIVSATPLLDAGTILMTIDPPMVLCWMWALVVGWRAVQPDGKTRDWLIVGLATGLGFLCKYTAVFQIVCWAILFALWPATRIHLRKRGPWLALFIFLICMIPVLIWNAQHGWITITHVAGDAGMHSRWHPTLRYFWDFVFAEMALLNPFFFVGAIWAAIGFWKFHRERPLWLYFFCMGTPVFLGYLLFSFHSRVLPNWIAPAVLPMFCLMLLYWNERWRIAKPLMTAGAIFGIVAVAIILDTNLIGKIIGRPLPSDKDPTYRIQGWRPTAALVESAREKLEAEGRPAFIIADHYGLTGLFSFYLPAAHTALKGTPLVYCMDSDVPENQFYFWPEYNYRNTRKGQNAIFVSDLDSYDLERGWVWKWLSGQTANTVNIPPLQPPPQRMVQEFKTVTDLGVQEVERGNHLVRRIHLWACYNLE
jgi:4-amino-4-deoxy-L-arabinose transferase-like glycosyltransferase/membrane-associated phospholipid phosphatase